MLNPVRALSSVKRYFEKKGLENDFLDFLITLLPLERSGLKLDQVFLEAVKGGVTLPKPYLGLAKRFYLIYVVAMDPYDSIKKLALTVPWEKLRIFLEGYVDVSLRVGDTLSYVESFIKEELSGIRTRVEDVFNLIDNLFEAYLIVALGTVIYFSLPILPIPTLVFLMLISAISTSAFLFSTRILRLALIDIDRLSFYSTLFLTVSTPLLSYVLGGLFYLQTVIVVSTGLSIYFINRRLLEFDAEFISFVENVYAESKEGYPVDQAIIRASSTCRKPIRWIGVLLGLGCSSASALNVFRFPRFHMRVLNSIAAPLGYSGVSFSYLNYVLDVIENLRGLRRRFEERTRVYYVYVGLMMVTLITVIKVFSTMPGFDLNPSIHLTHVVYSTLVTSLILASCFKNGFWYSSKTFYVYAVSVTVVLRFI